jgi:glucose/arabinose dehydrogenase
MPDGQETALSQREFADLIEYLASLRLPALADAGRAGMPSNIPQLDPPVGLIPIHAAESRFEHPCWVGQVPGATGTFLVCEHETGRVWRLTSGASRESKSLWGDFRREVRPGPATGLLGLTFHPRFRENRKYYIQHQIVVDGRIYARVSEKIAAPDLAHDSGQPSRTIIEFPCSTDVHSGGGIQFGPDGYLYIGMGDTGPQGDPEGHAQNLNSMLGKMLRIDVDHEDSSHTYAIPSDNPFRSQGGARPEIWAYGFREPWRFSFDLLTGDLWVGDVGQDRIEEVDIVRAGENFGWNVYEGFDLFSTRYRSERSAYMPPVFAYNRRLGNSITGGYVYRGERDSPFYGVYVCADFTSKRVWGLKQADRKLEGIWQLCTSPQEVASIGCDEAGTLYLVGYAGTIYRLDFSTATFRPVAQEKP